MNWSTHSNAPSPCRFPKTFFKSDFQCSTRSLLSSKSFRFPADVPRLDESENVSIVFPSSRRVLRAIPIICKHPIPRAVGRISRTPGEHGRFAPVDSVIIAKRIAHGIYAVRTGIAGRWILRAPRHHVKSSFRKRRGKIMKKKFFFFFKYSWISSTPWTYCYGEKI